jgi:hypothetical protein
MPRPWGFPGRGGLLPIPVHQSPFQKNLWNVARDAHAAGDRADARILMRMIEAIDEGDYALLGQLSVALRSAYRERCGPVPSHRSQDGARYATDSPSG